MGLLATLAAPFKRSSGPTFDQIIAGLDGVSGRLSKSGQMVTHQSALTVTTVLACVEAIASGCATPDLFLMRHLKDGQKEMAIDDPRFRILNRRPNEWQTSFEFRQTLTSHAVLTGNGYAIKVMVGGHLRELIPVPPSAVTIVKTDRYRWHYVVTDDCGIVGKFEPRQMFHLRNSMWDQIKGLDVVRQARDAIGLSLAAEEGQALLIENGGRPGGILSTDEKLSVERIDRLKNAWKKVSSGKNAFKTAVLDGGLKFHAMAMSGVDSQHLETRKHQVEEICRAFGVFPQIVMHSDKTATFASAEAFFSAHTRLTINKWQTNWCQRLDEFALDGEGPLFCEFDNRQMNAASIKDRGQYFAKALGAGGAPGWMTQNEVRSDLGLPPKVGGDELPKPTNAVLGAGGDFDEDDEESEDDDK